LGEGGGGYNEKKNERKEGGLRVRYENGYGNHDVDISF
jgi:hypothetical protein